MSCWLTGYTCSTSLKTAISVPSSRWTWVGLDMITALGCGSTAGRGRNRKEASTVPAVAIGTETPQVMSSAMARRIRRMSGSASHGGTRFRRQAPILTAVRPPSVDQLARSLAHTGLPHPLLVDIAREAIAVGDPETAAERAATLAAARARSLLRPVVNATGVLLHTNLGRAPLAAHSDARYSNLELDLGTGERGSRSAHAASLLARAAGAEAALVVNNGAAAVLLALAALAHGRSVPVSQGELVEIGGGFRVPEVLDQSGARLVEVGTTNRTRLADYQAAIDDTTGLVLKVHQSNYRIVGFTEAVGTAALAGLGPPVVVDLGSGLLDAACPWLAGGPPAWLAAAGEPAVRQTLEAGGPPGTLPGAQLVGGPPAGG